MSTLYNGQHHQQDASADLFNSPGFLWSSRGKSKPDRYYTRKPKKLVRLISSAYFNTDKPTLCRITQEQNDFQLAIECQEVSELWHLKHAIERNWWTLPLLPKYNKCLRSTCICSNFMSFVSSFPPPFLFSTIECRNCTSLLKNGQSIIWKYLSHPHIYFIANIV